MTSIEAPKGSEDRLPPPPLLFTTVSSITAVNGQLYSEEFWARAKDALLIFIGSPSDVLDSIEQAYGSCPIDRIRSGFLISIERENLSFFLNFGDC